jgi:hypothetical protein
VAPDTTGGLFAHAVQAHPEEIDVDLLADVELRHPRPPAPITATGVPHSPRSTSWPEVGLGPASVARARPPGARHARTLPAPSSRLLVSLLQTGVRMTTFVRRFRGVLLSVLLVGSVACATRRSGFRDSQATTGRLTNSPRENLAAMPVPDPGADPEHQDQRFGIESARERAETVKQKRAEKSRCVDVVSPGEVKKGTPPCPPAAK